MDCPSPRVASRYVLLKSCVSLSSLCASQGFTEVAAIVRGEPVNEVPAFRAFGVEAALIWSVVDGCAWVGDSASISL